MPEKEYIEREVAMNLVLNTSGDYATALCELRKLPAADVEPVVHAHWDWTCTCSFRCSNCNNIGHSVNDNFCPHCGAKMDGGENRGK